MFSIITKINAFNSFRDTVKSLGFKGLYSTFGAILVLLFEFSISILILFSSTQLYGKLLLFFLLIIFLLAVIIAKVKQLNVKCNCFGALTNETLGYKTLIHIAFLTFFQFVLLFDKQTIGVDQVSIHSTVNMFFTSFSIIFSYFLIKILFKINMNRGVE